MCTTTMLPPGWVKQGPDASGNYWYANTETGTTQWEAPAAPPPAPLLRPSSTSASASPFFSGKSPLKVQPPAFCLPPVHEPTAVSPTISTWKSHISLTLTIGVALALVAIALGGSSIGLPSYGSGIGNDSNNGGNSWSDFSSVVLSPSATDGKYYYSVVLAGSASSGYMQCKQAAQASSSSPFAVASGCSFSGPFTSSSSTWLSQTINGACFMTTSNKGGKTCSALSGLAGTGIFVYVLISAALVLITVAFAGLIEAHIIARSLAKKDDGDGGVAVLTSALRPARTTWGLLFAALVCIVFALVAWAIAVTAALGSIAAALLAGDYLSTGKLEDGWVILRAFYPTRRLATRTHPSLLAHTPCRYTSYILFRPGSSWYILLASCVLLAFALKQLVGKQSKGNARPTSSVEFQSR